MEDPVLLSRLKALSNNLPKVVENLKNTLWQQQPQPDSEGTRADLPKPALWAAINKTINFEVQRKLRQLKNEIDYLLEPAEQAQEANTADQANEEQAKKALPTAWERYSEILRDSQSLLRECLEIIGTLAIRNKDLDREILYLADELVRDCFDVATGDQENYYLTVPGLGDTLPAKIAQTVRMRFPEWTIWDLPLIAHELGRVAIVSREKSSDLSPFLVEQVQLLIEQDAGLRQNQPCAKDWARGRVSIFVADAFATFTMGPAYACSAINLRFNPCIEASQDTPSDAQRAYLVMSMLEWMSEFQFEQTRVKQEKPYATVIARLNKDWESAMTQSRSKCRLADHEKEYLKSLTCRFAGKIWEMIFFLTGMYPLEGWKLAVEWCTNWLDEQSRGPFSVPSIPPNPTPRLRDVLNATWLCRLDASDFSPAVEKGLEDVSKRLCKAIIAAKPSAGSGGSRAMTRGSG